MKYTTKRIVVLSLLFVNCMSAVAIATVDSFAINEKNYPPIPLNDFYLNSEFLQGVTSQTVDVSDMPFTTATRLTKTIKHNDSKEIQFATKIHANLGNNDLLLLSFYGRQVPQISQTNSSQLITIFEESQAPWTKSLNAGVNLTTEWQKFSFPIRVKTSKLEDKNPTKSYRLTFRLGFEEQNIELAAFTLIKLPDTLTENNIARSRLTYEGADKDAVWRLQAEERINTIRKAPIVIKVRDHNGNAISNAHVNIKMTQHAFIFGTAINAHVLDKENTPDSVRYLNAIKENFNQVVLEGTMKWPNWPESNKEADQVVNWALYHGLTIRGHNVIWPSWNKSPWEDNKAKIAYFEKHPQELEKEIGQRVSNIVGRYKGLLDEWDVVNEPYTNKDFMGLLGDKSMVEWFKQTRKLDPSSRLFINDYGILVNENNLNDKHLRGYAQTIQYLLDNNAPLKGIGMQGHFREVMTSPENLLATLDLFSKFGLPIVLTEYDHQSSDQELQAQYLHDVLTVMFSHSSVTGFLMWGFWDGAHWEKNAPLYNKDWALKPSGEMYKSLVLNKWWTKLNGVTDEQGLYQNTGFMGNYTATIATKDSVEKFNFKLTKESAPFIFELSEARDKK